MSVDNIVTILELILSESKIIFLSSHLQMLTLTCESFCSWMYPFFWHYILIPLLPARLLNYLQAPVPYMVGVQRNYYNEELLSADGCPTDVIHKFI